jgi:hypothetical protein
MSSPYTPPFLDGNVSHHDINISDSESTKSPTTPMNTSTSSAWHFSALLPQTPVGSQSIHGRRHFEVVKTDLLHSVPSRLSSSCSSRINGSSIGSASASNLSSQFIIPPTANNAYLRQAVSDMFVNLKRSELSRSHVSAQRTSLTNSVIALKKRNIILQQEVNEHKEHLTLLQKLTNSNVSNGPTLSEIRGSVLDAACKEKKSLSDKVNTLGQTVAELRYQIEQEAKERSIEVKALKEEIERLNNDAAQLNILHATRGRNIADLSETVELLKSESESKLNYARNQHVEAVRYNEQLKRDNDILIDERTRAMNDLSEATARAGSLERTVQSTLSQLSDSSRDMMAAKELIEKLQADLVSASQFSDSSHITQQYDREISRLREEYESRILKLQASQDGARRELEEKLLRATQLNEEQQAEIDSLSKELSGRDRMKQMSDALSATLRDENYDLQNKLSAADATVEALTERIAKEEQEKLNMDNDANLLATYRLRCEELCKANSDLLAQREMADLDRKKVTTVIAKKAAVELASRLASERSRWQEEIMERERQFLEFQKAAEESRNEILMREKALHQKLLELKSSRIAPEMLSPAQTQVLFKSIMSRSVKSEGPNGPAKVLRNSTGNMTTDQRILSDDTSQIPAQ